MSTGILYLTNSCLLLLLFHTACATAQCYNCWASYESCGLAQQPTSMLLGSLAICHQCKLGTCWVTADRCGENHLKYCIFSCAVHLSRM